MQCAPFLLLTLLLQQSDKITEIGSPPEPEAAEIFFVLQGGHLLPLERQNGTMHSRFMLPVAKTVIEFPCARSPVRFHSEERIEIVVRTRMRPPVADPSVYYLVRKFDSRKKVRELVFSSGYITPVGGSTKSDPRYGEISSEFSAYGDNSLKIVVGPLPPGEYSVGRSYSPMLFCFGVN
jgi:hypothetical protein